MTSLLEGRIAWILWNLTEELSRLLSELYEEDFEDFMETEARKKHLHHHCRKQPMDVPF